MQLVVRGQLFHVWAFGPGHSLGPRARVRCAPASFTLYDPRPARPFTVADLRGRSVNSPYLGRELPGEVRWTVTHGRITVADGELVDLEGLT